MPILLHAEALRYFSNQLNMTEKKTNYGSILKSMRFCFKTRGEAES